MPGCLPFCMYAVAKVFYGGLKKKICAACSVVDNSPYVHL